MKNFSLKEKNNNHKTEKYLYRALYIIDYNKLKKIADDSINDFILASPTSEISEGWSYDIISDKKKVSLFFNNSANQNGENIAIIIDLGHGTIDGNWVPGKNYLSEPIKKTYEKLLDVTWRALKTYEG